MRGMCVCVGQFRDCAGGFAPAVEQRGGGGGGIESDGGDGGEQMLKRKLLEKTLGPRTRLL
jgi:hypothetical protein